MKKTMKKTLALVLSLIMVFSCFTGIITVVQAEGNAIQAGDINGDGNVNSKDLTRLMKYISGEDVEVVEITVDPNGDGSVNSKDLTRLMRYLAGEDVEIFPKDIPVGCTHQKDEVVAKDATCTAAGNTAYWYCADCDKYFSDAEGVVEIALDDTVIEKLPHTEEIIPGYPATMTETGLSDGLKCSVCKTVIKEQEVIPISEFEIKYHIDDNDTYIKKLYESGVLVNPNHASYSSTTGINRLENLTVAGYTFEGWYDAPGSSGEIVKSIPANTTGKIELYAKWTKVTYWVYFDSPDIPWDSIPYTVDTGAPLTTPSHFGYTFVGWSNDDGFIVNRVKPGTVGNMTLHANWTSDRKKAVSYSNYGEPVIIEDADNGQFLFVYDIGRIENIPVSVVDGEMGVTKSEGIEINRSFAVSNSVTNDEMTDVVKSVSNATTKSSGWTLSKEWESLYAEGVEDKDKQVKTEERTDSEGKVVGGNYFVSNSKGGSSFSSVESGGSSSSSSKVTTENSFGINKSYDKSTDKYCDAKLSVENKTEVGAKVSVPVSIAKVEAGVKNTTTVGAETTSGRKDTTAYHADSSVSGFVGTVNTNDSSSYYNTVSNNESNWNSTTSYEQSHETSIDSSVTNAIATEIAKTTTYNIQEALGGGETTIYELDESVVESGEYSHAAKFSKGTTDTTTVEYKAKSTAYGYYRLVMAATVHVYGVVGYDVATSSYYTYTYNVLSDDRTLYLDFSKDTSTFDDCENGLVTFEVPFEVNEYILGVTSQTPGMKYGLDSDATSIDTVTGFTATKDFDGTVVVPQYQSAYNDTANTYSAIKVTKLDAKAFAGNTEIKTVVLPLYVTEIPDGAFEGCTNLEMVLAFGVTKIGKNAFKGCSSLKGFMIDNYITELGEGAFEGTHENCTEETHKNCVVSVMAANSAVADAAIKSGADNIKLNLRKLTDSYDNKKVEITEGTNSFTIVSDGRAYKNLQIDSKANETGISDIRFTENKDTPIKVNSDILALANVTVENAPGFALISTKDNAEIKLYQNNKLQSSGENAVISKNVVLSETSASIDGKMILKGNFLVCGTLTENKLLSFNSGEVKAIDDVMYESYLTSSVVTFDANGGAVGDATKTVYYGQYYGEMPVPTRENYGFGGWFTAKEGGTQITSESVVDALVNQTLYAQWIPNQFTVIFDANGGSVSTTSKALAFEDSYGTLPVPTRDNYTFAGWFTSATGGTQVSENDVPTEAKDVTLYAQWTPNKFTVTYNANGGSVSTTNKELTFGDSYGTLPTPTRDYYNFLGWNTAADGAGTTVYTDTVPSSAENVTLYAIWELKPVSGWVQASAMPANAQVVNEKWTYTKRYYKESRNTSESGWTQYGSKWVQSGSGSFDYAYFPSGFATDNWFYQNWAKGPYSSYENATSKRDVSTVHNGYIYWHWMYNVNYANTTNRTIADRYCSADGLAFYYFSAFHSTENCSSLGNSYVANYAPGKAPTTYNCANIMPSGWGSQDGRGTPRYLRTDAYKCYYTDYYKLFYYYQDVHNNESKTDPTGQADVLNVVKYVQYREK